MNFHPQESIALFIDGPNLHLSALAPGFDTDCRKLLALFDSHGRSIRAFYYTAPMDDRECSPLRPPVDWLDYDRYTMDTTPAKEFTDAMGTGGSSPIWRYRDRRRRDGDGQTVDRIVLFSGDGDFCRLIAAAQSEGLRVSVVSTLRTSPPMVADEPRRQADAIIELQDLAPQTERPPRPMEGRLSTPAREARMPPDDPAGRPPSESTSPQSQRPQLPRRARAPAPGPPAGLAPRADSEGKTLTVARSISFSGWIGSCERLTVEGTVETEIDACHFLTVAASGVFRGRADVERADVSGTVEGFLTVCELLTVRASGRILGGSISNGELEIERGGAVTGTFRLLPQDAEWASLADTAPLASCPSRCSRDRPVALRWHGDNAGNVLGAVRPNVLPFPAQLGFSSPPASLKSMRGVPPRAATSASPVSRGAFLSECRILGYPGMSPPGYEIPDSGVTRGNV